MLIFQNFQFNRFYGREELNERLVSTRTLLQEESNPCIWLAVTTANGHKETAAEDVMIGCLRRLLVTKTEFKKIWLADEEDALVMAVPCFSGSVVMCGFSLKVK